MRRQRRKYEREVKNWEKEAGGVEKGVEEEEKEAVD